jgi:hypothetical protein
MHKIFRRGRLLKFVCGAILAAATVANFFFAGELIFREAANLWYGHASKNWERTTGTIEASLVRTEKHRGTVYIPIVNYRYTVDGRVYRSSRIEATGNFGPQRAYMLVRSYPEDAEVTVFHDRESGLSALVTGVRIESYVGLVTGCFWLLVAGLLGLALYELFKTPETEFDAEWHVIRRDGFTKVRDMSPVERERRIRFELGVEKEIAERKSEMARRKAVK